MRWYPRGGGTLEAGAGSLGKGGGTLVPWYPQGPEHTRGAARAEHTTARKRTDTPGARPDALRPFEGASKCSKALSNPCGARATPHGWEAIEC
eukprot:13938594-Alexandrium_andersonii.AAC.1